MYYTPDPNDVASDDDREGGPLDANASEDDHEPRDVPTTDEEPSRPSSVVVASSDDPPSDSSEALDTFAALKMLPARTPASTFSAPFGTPSTVRAASPAFPPRSGSFTSEVGASEAAAVEHEKRSKMAEKRRRTIREL